MAPTALRIRRSPGTVFVQVFIVAILLGVFSLVKSRYHDASVHDVALIANKLHRRDEAVRSQFVGLTACADSVLVSTRALSPRSMCLRPRELS